MNPILSKNFSLSENEFQDLCFKLQNGDESLLEKMYVAHFGDCQAYLRNRLNATEDESYDATMQTLVLFRKNILRGKVSYGNLRFLFTQMAYYEIIKIRNKKEANDKNEKERIRYISVEVDNDEERSIKMKQAINSLSHDQKELLLNHYYKNMKLSEIAIMIGAPQTTIRKRKERILSKLKEYIQTTTSKNKQWHTSKKNISKLK